MPKYSFECQNPECGLQFDRVLKMGEHLVLECPGCTEMAPRLFQHGFAFAFKVPDNKVGNSGVHKEDYPTADHGVGRSAESRWEYYRERAKVKEQVRAGGQVPRLIRVDGPGYTEYEALPTPKADVRRAMAQKALAAMQAAKSAKLLVPVGPVGAVTRRQEPDQNRDRMTPLSGRQMKRA